MRGVLDLSQSVCKTCGKLFGRTIMPSGRIEHHTNFMRRKYCCLRCANTRTDVRPKTFLWRARKYRKNRCEACGETRLLQVHHCDQNQTNNSIENLQTLCKFCHDFLHATAKRVGVRVAGRMVSLELQQAFQTESSDSKPLETDKFQQWLNSHGGF